MFDPIIFLYWGNIVNEKALEIVKELNVENFNASNEQTEQFKE